MKNRFDSKEPEDFSIVLGGPLFQLLLRMRLTTPDLNLLKKRIIYITLFAWLPLLLLSIVKDNSWANIGLSFFSDFELQARFLLALPLLIAAELLVHKQLRKLVGQFVDRDIITKNEMPRFKEVIASAIKMRNSVTFEVILLLLVFVGGHYLWNTLSILNTITPSMGPWYAGSDATGQHLSLAGYWYIFVSRPIFQFIVLRWYYRIFIWSLFLWRCSKLKLNLVPTHPDRTCGLGFLSMSSSMFAPLILAHGVLLAGLISNSLFFGGARIEEFIPLIISVVVFIGLIILGPLLVFSPCLSRTKRAGLCEYGALASGYVGEFDRKWLRGRANRNEPLMGTPDLQSLADLSNSFQVVRDIRSFPIDKDTIIQLLAYILIPVLPLILTILPLKELVAKLFRAVF
jgi:hypothetical protein